MVFQSYFENREQYLKLSEILSDLERINIGVWQGTILGSILFVVYLNALLKLKIAGQIVSFADDMTLVFKGNT